MAEEWEYIIRLDDDIRTFQSIEDAYDFFRKVRKRHGLSHVYRTTLAKEFKRLANCINVYSDNDPTGKRIASILTHVLNSENGFASGCYAIEEYPTSDYCVWLCSEEDALLRALQYVLDRRNSGGSAKYGIAKAKRKNTVPVSANLEQDTVNFMDYCCFNSGLTRDQVINLAVRKYCMPESGDNHVHG